MADLSHWDAAIDFTAEEGAALAVGLDPSEPGYVRTKSKPIYDRMKGCYSLKIQWLKQDENPSEKPRPLLGKSDDMLESVGMSMALDEWDYEEGEGYPEWLINEIDSDFDTLRFTRKEMGRWLAAIGINSVYMFDPAMPQITESKQVGHWPWGEHHTKALGHLEAAAQLWKDYKPSDVTTAPTNKVVIAWLQSKFDISDNKAEAIASILRGDDIPTGPKKIVN